MRNAAKSRLIADPAGEGVSRADVVIEAIVENLEVKQQLLKGIEAKLKPGAVLATNTSSLQIEDIAKPLAFPGRLIGLHFFNPVSLMPLVEVVKGVSSWDEEVKKGCAFVTAIDKFPLVTKSVPGFLVNRILTPYMFGAMKRLEEGEDKEKIDAAAREFGMPMGPIELADSVGLDVCEHVSHILKFSTEGSQLSRLVASNRLGRKTGEGFYVWKDGKIEKSNTEFSKSELQKLGRELVEPMIAEAERCRDEHVVENADLVDAGVIFGTGFAPFRGGPLHFKAAHPAASIDDKQAAAAE